MKYNELGNTGIKVSKLCFGGLTVGPLQANLSPAEGGRIIRHAFENGVNFIDTAQLYQTYDHIHEGLKGMNRHDIVIASKSYAYDYRTAIESVEEALKALNTDYIDVFMLHEQESEHTIRGHYEALETFLKLKEKGIIRAVGLSTHAVAGVKAALKYKEIEVIHPIINISGLGIIDGTLDEMIQNVTEFHNRGGGVFSMKPLGGGNLLNRIETSFDFALNLQCVDSIAVGMQSMEEVDYNIKRFQGELIQDSLKDAVKRQPRKLHIASWCVNCGACIEKCSHSALTPGESRPVIHYDKCVLCGYCASVCKDFCIKVV
ncbi:MAG: aldo/keto reductase [Clostridia bacterium]|nr:aldo/keto reductase [Clostridia bacterium]